MNCKYVLVSTGLDKPILTDSLYCGRE